MSEDKFSNIPPTNPRPTIGRIVIVDCVGWRFAKPGVVTAIIDNSAHPEVEVQIFGQSSEFEAVQRMRLFNANVFLGQAQSPALYAQWMPYQAGQAAKTEELTKELIAATASAAQPVELRSAPGLLPEGMTLRDWFAGQALASLGAIMCQLRTQEAVAGQYASAEQFTSDMKLISGDCYEIADNMLAERDKRRAGPGPISTGDAELDARLRAMQETALQMGDAAAAHLVKVISDAIETWRAEQNENHQDTEGTKE